MTGIIKVFPCIIGMVIIHDRKCDNNLTPTTLRKQGVNEAQLWFLFVDTTVPRRTRHSVQLWDAAK